MRDCERCGGEVSWTCDTIEMIGGVAAHLCNSCRREFNDFCIESSEWRALSELKALRLHYHSLAQSQRPVSEEAWMEFAAKDVELDKALAAMSNRFLATKAARVEK